MDGRNCTGRTISLLNDHEGDSAAIHPHHQHQHQHQHHHLHQHHSNKPSPDSRDEPARLQRPLFAAHSRSSSSSCASPPSPLSPPLSTPALVRSESSSSDSHAFHTPSPLTPSYASFDFTLPSTTSTTTNTTKSIPPTTTSSNTAAAAAAARQQRVRSHAQQYFIAPPSQAKPDEMDDLNHASLYPPIPDATGAIPPSAYPMPMPIVQMPALQQMQAIPASPVHMQPAQQPHRASTSPASEPSRVSAHSAASNAKAQSKKNQYPCPMAKQFGCTDFFTTSGHAARHAKKHTGKKDAFCPECNKAFTRKDNMEQHRRTHQNGRGASRSTASAPSDDSKVKKSTKQAVKKTVAKAEPQLEAAVEQQLAEQQQQQELLQHQQQQQHRQQLLDSQMIPQVATLPVQQSMLPQGLLDQSMMMPPTCGPYFMGGNGMDAIPVASLPMAMPDLSSRPQLQRSSYGMNSLDYVAPAAPMTISEEGLHYSYPSPGLSNGLNSLALAASEHQRLSQEKALSTSPSCEQMRDSPSSLSDETP